MRVLFDELNVVKIIVCSVIFNFVYFFKDSRLYGLQENEEFGKLFLIE